MPSAKYEKAVLYLVNQWQSGRTLKNIAADFHVDPGNLDRVFRRLNNQTFKEFVNRRRKEYVIHRLKDDGVFGYQIGLELGFSNDLSFYRWIKREFGMSLGRLRDAINLETASGMKSVESPV